MLAFVDAVEADPAIELHSLMVMQHGHVVAEGWWAPHTPERTRLLYSLSKSFTSTALGLALEEGRVGLDDPVVSYFPEFDAGITDPRSRSVTLGHLASAGQHRVQVLLGVGEHPAVDHLAGGVEDGHGMTGARPVPPGEQHGCRQSLVVLINPR